MFSLKPEIYYGENSLQSIRELNYKKVCIATDKLMMDLGHVKTLTDILDSKGVEYHIFDDIQPDPSLELVNRGLIHIIKTKPDGLIALGGGSVIDAAKAIIYFCINMKKELVEPEYIHKPDFIAIPTTAGTGSEVTGYSVITDTEKEIKLPLVDKLMLPDIAILDPTLIASVPAGVTAATGMDVLTHSIEAYVSRNQNPFSDCFAMESIKLVHDNLVNSYKDLSNLKYRENMLIASCMGGIAFNNSGLGINHSIAHILGARYHIPHGLANAIILPYAVKYNTAKSEKARKDYSDIAVMLGYSHGSELENTAALISYIIMANKEMNIPLSVKTLVGDDFMKEVDEMAQIAFEDKCSLSNPAGVAVEDIKSIMIDLYKGIFE
jgi:alcohol dehydrogenase class IV